MTRDEMREIALSFPGAEEGVSYGRPAFKVNGKFFTRLRAEDDSVVLVDVPFDEREMLMEAEPQTFHFTAHYKDYPSVLARLEPLHAGSFRAFLERRFRRIAKKSVVKAWEATQPTSSPGSSGGPIGL
ncbi:MmcQ/YjbR family DNA-binding protein [Phenylobacterium sp.]|uniref:MmcQ/YjbR family DNA-binding protein n=1 Tax=Phenylobacterium sp. TaxID=1871053 RepID=UPI0025F828A4|nr:MmcQ/YjbR family DNA-binding protein [Phenylobacterium sp.]MBX3484305.1 MmcQ/YjbR family DNA-binding protein [Phenylobacterium sp.]